MAENRFDAFTKYLAQAPSRRLVLKGLAAALAGIGLAALPRAGAAQLEGCQVNIEGCFACCTALFPASRADRGKCFGRCGRFFGDIGPR
jgi:hypothetical protein